MDKMGFGKERLSAHLNNVHIYSHHYFFAPIDEFVVEFVESSIVLKMKIILKNYVKTNGN
jgi:hypothetical protein